MWMIGFNGFLNGMFTKLVLILLSLHGYYVFKSSLQLEMILHIPHIFVRFRTMFRLCILQNSNWRTQTLRIGLHNDVFVVEWGIPVQILGMWYINIWAYLKLSKWITVDEFYSQRNDQYGRVPQILASYWF